jgi:hypothetical protein
MSDRKNGESVLRERGRRRREEKMNKKIKVGKRKNNKIRVKKSI